METTAPNQRVPRDVADNVRWRRRMMDRAASSVGAKETLIEACRADLLFYVNAFVWTIDPRSEGGIAPFCTWPFQDEALGVFQECIRGEEDLVIEKSRDMGASWMSLLVMEWMWHFHPHRMFLMISRNAEMVDSPSPDSLFWKIDFAHRNMPKWLMPRLKRLDMSYENLDNGSHVFGQATTRKAGVGGRATAAFIDEFSQIDQAREILYRTYDTTNCRIFNFTHVGTHTMAYELTRRENVRKLRLHWSLHPRKNKGLYQYDEANRRRNVLDDTYDFGPDYVFIDDGKLRSPWYDRECEKRKNPRQIAMDLDIDPGGASSRLFDKALILRLQETYCCPPYWQGDVRCDSETGQPLGLVPTAGGPLTLWCNPDKDGRPPPAPYGGGLDVASGTGATASRISVFDARTGEKVLEYANPHILPHQLARVAAALGRLFRNRDGEVARLAWEHLGPGVVFGRHLIDLGYRHIHYRKKEDVMGRPEAAELAPGWYPSPNNKRALLEDYRAALEEHAAINRSARALDECLKFVYTQKGSIEHAEEASPDDPSGARVNHADQAIADALAWKMVGELGYTPSRPQAEEVKPGTLAWRRQLAGAAADRGDEW